MENQIIKKSRGRPRKTKEEKTKNKTHYMLNKIWYCPVCIIIEIIH